MLPADAVSILVGILLKDVQRNPDSELVRFFGGVTGAMMESPPHFATPHP